MAESPKFPCLTGNWIKEHAYNHHHNHFTAFFRDHPGEPVPEENFWTLWCKGRLTEADTDHPAGCHSIQTNQCPPPPSLIYGWITEISVPYRKLGSRNMHITTTTTILRPFFRDHPGEPVPEENFWTLWCKGRLKEADTDHPAGRHSIQTNQCPPPPSPHAYQWS